jgi:hypothetical protein
VVHAARVGLRLAAETRFEAVSSCSSLLLLFPPASLVHPAASSPYLACHSTAVASGGGLPVFDRAEKKEMGVYSVFSSCTMDLTVKEK